VEQEGALVAIPCPPMTVPSGSQVALESPDALRRGDPEAVAA
jgi:hypothetical protein